MAVAADVLVDHDSSGIVTVTLHNPDRRNAVTFAMWCRLAEIFGDFRERSDVRAVILTGAGGNFSAGADISEFPRLRSTPEGIKAYGEAGHAATVAIRDLPQPTIAAVTGYGVGGGCGLALACDFRTGDETTRMGIPAAKRGIVYSVLDSQNLLRTVGLPRAKRVLYTGRLFPLGECVAMGLIDEVGEDGAIAAARRLAEELVARAPLSQRGAKLTLEALARDEAAARMSEIIAAQKRAADSEDYREATASFIEKRPPVFQGR
ncbi:MAG: enoyl-CoA hydratase/isomerase family protein [Rhodospirillales bacterium]|nr:enoyl-CoA hydratase/isomerase family protein [Rhodospirillales bacterium]